MAHYMTIVLELLEQRPEIHDQLRHERTLLATASRYAEELKILHQAWTQQLAQARPDSDDRQLSSQALELALQELEASLPSELVQGESGPLSLDEAMAFLRRHTPPA